MPAEGVQLTPKDQLMTADEVVGIAQAFVKMGVNKIRLTGGEPLLRKDFTEISERLAQLPIKLTLTTNAVILDRHLDHLIAIGVKSINVSLDTLDKKKFLTITKRDQYDKAYDNIMLALQRGLLVKLNLVLIKGFNDDEIIDFIQLTKDHSNLVVRFIEFMPFDGNSWNRSKLVTQDEILDKVNQHWLPEQVMTLPNEPHFTARNYQINGFKGQFGIISTVSNPFCDACNRIRLTANGKIKNCLFSSTETDILTQYRAGEPIDQVVQAVFKNKKAVRGGMVENQDFENPEKYEANRSMITIGG